MRSVLVVLAMVLSAVCYADVPRCAMQAVASREYVVCVIDVKRDALRMFDLDSSGAAFQSFDKLAAALAQKGEKLEWAMNAGMYDPDGKPVGFYVEDGRQQKALSLRDGPGNFHMKPNGVFYVVDGQVGVAETRAFAAANLHPQLATQSGPMLVVDGVVHPQIMSTGTSRKVRNAVGVRDAHTAIFVVSAEPVTFWELATLFRDSLGCKNALFLDGTVSSLHAPELKRHDSLFPLGPILAVTRAAR